MTWVKTSDDFPDACARVHLSDAAYRTHHEGLSWTMRRLTDGRLDRIDIRRLAESPDALAAIEELVSVGFWKVTDEGWLIVHGMADQPTAERVMAQREATRVRQERFRAKGGGQSRSRAAKPGEPEPRDPASPAAHLSLVEVTAEPSLDASVSMDEDWPPRCPSCSNDLDEAALLADDDECTSCALANTG